MRVSPERPKSASVGRIWVEGAAVCARYPEKDLSLIHISEHTRPY